jgi:hypothetical protein
VNPAFALAAALCALAALLPPEIHPAARVAAHLLAAAAAIVLGFTRGSGATGWRRAALLLLPLAGASLLFAGGGRARGLDEAAAFTLFALAVLLGRRIAAHPDASMRLLALVALLGTAVSLQAMGQHHWAYPDAAAALRAAQDPAADAFLVRLEAGRPAGPFSLPAALAGFLALALPATLAARWSARGVVVRAAWGVALLAQAYALLLTRSLGGLLAATVALGLLAAHGRARAWRVAIAAALLFAAGAAVFVYARRAEIGAHPGGDPISLRLGNWRVALGMLRDHPILGVGPGRFPAFYPRYVRPGMNETQFAHNSYLQVGATWGAWALGPLACGAAVCLARRRRDGASAAAAAAGAGFLLHNVVDFTFFLPGVAIPAALLLGSGSPPRAPRQGNVDGAEAADPGAAARAAVAPAGTAARFAPVLVAVLFLVHAATADRSAWHLDRARAAAARGGVEEAEREARAAASACPWDPDPWAFVAQSLLARQAMGAAEESLRREAATRAVALEPDAAILHHTAALDRAASGDPAAAWVEEAVARRLYPGKALYHDAPEETR